MKFRNFVIMLSVMLMGYTTVSFWGTSAASSETQTLPSAVEDQVVQYNIAVRAGTKTDRCVQAGFVASSYIQAKDEANYEEWQRIRHDDCRAAGLPE